MPKPDLKIATIYESNYRDAAATLRVVADDIENGTHGDVGTCALVVLSDTGMHVFGMGPESEAPSVGMLFHAAALRFTKTIEEHGKEE